MSWLSQIEVVATRGRMKRADRRLIANMTEEERAKRRQQWRESKARHLGKLPPLPAEYVKRARLKNLHWAKAKDGGCAKEPK